MCASLSYQCYTRLRCKAGAILYDKFLVISRFFSNLAQCDFDLATGTAVRDVAMSTNHFEAFTPFDEQSTDSSLSPHMPTPSLSSLTVELSGYDPQPKRAEPFLGRQQQPPLDCKQYGFR